VGRDSAVATGWRVWGSDPGGGQIFRTRPDRPWDPHCLLYNVYCVSFLELKWLGRGIDRSHPSGPSWPVPVLNFTYTLSINLFYWVYIGIAYAGEMSKCFSITSTRITKERTRRIYFSVQKFSDAVVLAGF
jgi:hypothetical protein